MRVDFNPNQSLLAGNVYMKRITQNDVFNEEVLKKIAEKNNVDLWITKSQNSKFLHKNDMYTVTAREELNIPPYTKRGVAVTLPQKIDDTKTVTEKVFGAIFQAIENLRNKI
jgi:hypothetical protein